MQDKNRQEHDQDEHVLPENDYPGIEQLVERDAPRAFCAPERSAEADQPRTISCAVCFELLHWQASIVGGAARQSDTINPVLFKKRMP